MTHPKRVEYPHRSKGPKDVGETFDLVVRKEPISLYGLMDQIHSYSQDDVFGHLDWLETHGYLTKREGDLETDGTTRELYEVHSKRVQD